ncbi:hypothetical protein VNO78_10635 [Psophocarpus tetragonolobus]|uniref:Spatacsin C-terminal domain-containing protein n=1 Tax=Psophocarpus tetragonolobus TaxID=3891 RepID=A0AAN9SL18_PSOTE
MAALATLMYSALPFQSCLNSGGVNRHSNSSAQCTLENLRPTLQKFPTLWRTLVGACLGQDTMALLVPKAKTALADYLNWHDDIFFSTGRDTSLLQMLPCWFPKAIRRLIQLYVQGPLGCQSFSGFPTGETLLHRDIDLFINAEVHAEISAISWEATIQRHIEEELYGPLLEENEFGLEHFLHRGRALAAFNQILGHRLQNLRSDGESSSSAHGQTNTQSDVHTLLSPPGQSEETLLSSVLPIAIMHFENSTLVAACGFLLELCGLSANKMHIDIAVLKRISSFYKYNENNENLRQLSPKGSVFHAISHQGDVTESLARALADEYLRKDSRVIATETGSINKHPSRALILVLHHLEKASIPRLADGETYGSWLLSGKGDGNELRSQRKAASQHWSLVTNFCRLHQLLLSTKYLAVLARDNDWIEFLSEAQIGGYSFDTVVQVASKEFSDPRLRLHMLTVLRGMQSKKKTSPALFLDTLEKGSETPFPDESMCVPVELFQILAECEKQKCPGEALLRKAKELSWSILAMVASCFLDVSPLSCLTVWLEITAARETSSIKVNDIASQIADNVGAAVNATNSLPVGDRVLTFHYNRQSPKRRRLITPVSLDSSVSAISDISSSSKSEKIFHSQSKAMENIRKAEHFGCINVPGDSDEGPGSLSKMVAVLCEQQLFLPLLRAFEMFLPSCPLLPFIRALQGYSQMRLSEASAHLGSFSARIKEEPMYLQANMGRDAQIGASWISSTASTAADAVLSTCPSPYEKRCLLQLLAATDFGDGGYTAAYYRRICWKINLAEPLLRKDNELHLGDEISDDASLLSALENNRHWEQARNWAKHLEANTAPWKSATYHVTESQAESMVAEWKEFLWDVPEERVALWNHCHTLFIRYSFPSLQAGLFFLKHAEAVEKDLPARELHELLLLSLQWLSGMINLSNPVCPSQLLREIETKVWLLAVESETQVKSEEDLNFTFSTRESGIKNDSSIIDRTASIIAKMDNHINTMRSRTVEKYDSRENNQIPLKNQMMDVGIPTNFGGNTKTKRRAKGYMAPRHPPLESADKSADTDDGSSTFSFKNELQSPEENVKVEMSFSRWEERVGAAELESAVLSLLEFGQIAAAKQLQYKLSPGQMPSEFRLVDTALKLAAISTPPSNVSVLMLDEEVCSVMQSYRMQNDNHYINPLQILESLVAIFTEGNGRGLCKKIIAVIKAANTLGLLFSEAFNKQPIELLQLLSLKAQDSFEEAKFLVQTHTMPAASIAQILAESFLKGVLAAHRGGYMDSQKEEGPVPLLWRFSDFLKWAELCPSEPEIGHALMRLVITGQEIPHACEVELLILSHHFYKSSSCLDGVDVLVALAATRVDAYVLEGDFLCLARLITGVGNFYALNFILGILIENGQLDLLLQKYSAAADTNAGTAEAVRGFRMAVLTSLKHFNTNDLDAFAMVYNHFDMKHETAALLESRAEQSCQQWFHCYNKDQNEDLLDSMRYFIEAAEVHSSIDAGNKTRRACAQASLLSLQIRMPDLQWLYRSETNARRALVEQSRFQEALIVAEAYNLNQPSEWALVLWNQMLKPEVMEEFVAEFVAVLPLQPSMLTDLARFYRAEVAARGDQSNFSLWLTGGGLPAEWAKYLGRSFRCLLKRTRDLKLRMQLATVATGFGDVIDVSNEEMDKVLDNSAPLVLRKGHETSSMKVNDMTSQIADNVGSAVNATNALPVDSSVSAISDISSSSTSEKIFDSQSKTIENDRKAEHFGCINVPGDSDEGPASPLKVVAVLCEQQLFLPLLRAFEMFLPSRPLLTFIRALQVRPLIQNLSSSFSVYSRIADTMFNGCLWHINKCASQKLLPIWAPFLHKLRKNQCTYRQMWEEMHRLGHHGSVSLLQQPLMQCFQPAHLLTKKYAYCILEYSSYMSYYRRICWKINLADPLLRKDNELHLGDEISDDASLLSERENNRHWEQARNWAKHLEANTAPWKSATHHITESQAESMVAEWKEFLWDVPEERVALLNHCHTLFIRYSFPSLLAGLFFLKHAKAVEKDLPARELHELLLLSLQWLSGMINLSNPVCPSQLLREIETKVWLLAVESETQVKSEEDLNFTFSTRESGIKNDSSIIDRTASIIAKMDNHINTMRSGTVE